MTQTVRAGLTLSCLVAALPSVPADLPIRKVVPQAQEPLLQLPHRGAGPFPFPLCFLLSFLVAWASSYPPMSLWFPASVQDMLSENCTIPNVLVQR